MAQWRIDQQKKVEQNSKTLYELGMIATVDGNPVTNTNPFPVTLGSNNITITGNVNVGTTVQVSSTPENPVHNHISEVGTSGILDVPYMPVGGNVSLLSDGAAVSASNPLPVALGDIMGANVNIYTTVINQVDLSAVNTNIIPVTDNAYSLGNTSNRWSSIHVGPGTVYIQDQSNSALNAALTVNNGVLQINGTDQLQVGQLKFVNNTIESATGGVDIQIGLTGSTADLVLNRNTVVANDKTLTVGNIVTNSIIGNENAVNLTTTIGNTWAFGAEGDLLLPSGATLGDTYRDGQGVGLAARPNSGSYAIINSNDLAQYVEVNNDVVWIGTNYNNGTGSGLTWAFDKTGALTLPQGGILKENNTTTTKLSVTVLPGTGSVAGTGVNQSPANQWTNNTTYPIGTPCQLVLTNATGDWLQFDQVRLYIASNNGTNVGLSSDPGGNFPISVVTGTFDSGTLQLLAVVNSVVINTGVSNKSWLFGSDGNLTFPDTTIQNTAYHVVAPPATSSGKSGDQAGMVAYSNAFFYYCTANYTTGGIQIWQRIAKDATAW